MWGNLGKVDEAPKVKAGKPGLVLARRNEPPDFESLRLALVGVATAEQAASNGSRVGVAEHKLIGCVRAWQR